MRNKKVIQFITKKKKDGISYINNKKEFIMLYSITFVVILVARLFVILFPENSFIINSYEVHHLFIGILILLFSIIPIVLFGEIYINKKLRHLLLIIIGIGIGLIIDEFIFLISGGRTNNDYWNTISIYGVIITFVFFSIFYFLFYFWSQKQ